MLNLKSRIRYKEKLAVYSSIYSMEKVTLRRIQIFRRSKLKCMHSWDITVKSEMVKYEMCLMESVLIGNLLDQEFLKEVCWARHCS